MKFDMRFSNLEWELHLQGSYLDMLGTHLPAIVEAERARLRALYDDQPEDERGGLDFIEWDLDRGVLTRSFVAASIIGLSATYEMAVISVAEVARKQLGLRLKLEELRGSFLEQAQRYYEDVLRFQLHASPGTLTGLHDLA